MTENEMKEVVKEAFNLVNTFNCRKVIEFRDLEMLKRYKAQNKGWSEDILGLAREYARYGSIEEMAKSEKIVAWIEAEEPSWK